MAIEIRNGRFWMNDFQVYRNAAARLLEGQFLYRTDVDGFYHFKYSPAAAIFFIPWTALPPVLANIVYWGLLTLAFVLVNRCITLFIAKERSALWQSRVAGAQLICGIAFATHIFRELHLGQVNLLLMSLYIFAWCALQHRREGTAGALLAVSLTIKPYALIFLAHMLVRGRPKVIAAALAWTGIWLSVPFFIYGFDVTLQLYQHWFTEVVIELSSKSELTAHNNYTLAGFLTKFLELAFGLRSTGFLAVTGVFAVAGSVYVGSLLQNRRDQRFQGIVWAFLCVLIPIFAATDANAYIFAWPAAWLCVYDALARKTAHPYLLVIGLIFMGLNAYDIIGANASHWLNAMSLCALGGALIGLQLTRQIFELPDNKSASRLRKNDRLTSADSLLSRAAQNPNLAAQPHG